jgi:hypothetical protein
MSPAVTSPGPASQHHALGALALHADGDLLDVQHDVGDVLAHARDRRELVQHAVDLHGGDAAPCSDDSSTRRSALPSVRPKPRSSGSATTVALRFGS